MPSKLNIIKDKEKPWYSKGLRFKCTGCGACCTGSPGVVWVNDQEIKELAEFLNLSIDAFSLQYLRLVGGRLSLKEMPKNYDCIFLKNKKCSVYEVRPKQCRSFPWWLHQLESEKAWIEAKKFCEGIDHPDAPIFSSEEIQTLAESN